MPRDLLCQLIVKDERSAITGTINRGAQIGCWIDGFIDNHVHVHGLLRTRNDGTVRCACLWTHTRISREEAPQLLLDVYAQISRVHRIGIDALMAICDFPLDVTAACSIAGVAASLRSRKFK